jgi:serine protease DegS
MPVPLSSLLQSLRGLAGPALVGLVVAIGVLFWLDPAVDGSSRTALGGPRNTYSGAVKEASPAVVNIYTTQQVQQQRAPRDPFFDRFMEEPRRQRALSSLGSGVITDADGYVLTSHHVVRDADGILVALQDGREGPARVVGTDPETDLALLQVEMKNLPVMDLSDPGPVGVGDVVLAIGNPLGVGQTVSMGIVSATGRSHLGLATFENFIQTDAAINRGNSGGALINTDGDLIGINSAILSSDGSWQGIGFATPVSIARRVMKDLIEHGRVIRGWLGVTTKDVTPALAESLGMEEARGGVITEVVPNSPAARSGLKPGDLLMGINGKPLADGYEAMNRVAGTRPGETITVTIVRLGQRMKLDVSVGTRPPVQP